MSMPEFSPNYCSNCGEKLSTKEIERRERLWCENCKNVEWLNPRVCAGILIRKEDEFLLQKRGIQPRKGKWSIPAGYLELEETPLEAAKRETFEETGLRVTGEPEFLDHLSIGNPDGSKVVVAIFTISFEEIKGNITPDKDEVEGIRFWSLEEMRSNSQKIEHKAYLTLIEELKE